MASLSKAALGFRPELADPDDPKNKAPGGRGGR